MPISTRCRAIRRSSTAANKTPIACTRNSSTKRRRPARKLDRLRPELVAEQHSNHNRKHVSEGWKSPQRRTDRIAQWVSPCPQRKRFFEHEQESHQGARSGDEGKYRRRGQLHFSGPAGNVRPRTGPHRKCPSSTPITTAMKKAEPG